MRKFGYLFAIFGKNTEFSAYMQGYAALMAAADAVGKDESFSALIVWLKV
jgi:hypothetical protein